MASLGTGNRTEVLWGPFRLSREGSATAWDFMRPTINKPGTLSENFRIQEAGSKAVESVTFMLTRDVINDDLYTAYDVETLYPMFRYQRSTAGNLCELVDDVALARVPTTETVDEWVSHELGFAAEANSMPRMELGLLFDHTISDPAGVTAPTLGVAVNLGAVAADESITLVWANPHSPAPTVVGGESKAQHATDSPFTIPVDLGVAFPTATTTAAFQTQTIAGPVVGPWYRYNVTAVTSGAFFPLLGAFIHKT